MDALIAREQAFATEASKSTGGAKRAPAAGEPGKKKKKKKEQQQAAPAAPAYDSDDPLLDGLDDEPDEEDSELEENGSFVPDLLVDPASAAAGEQNSGRRVYLEGVPGRTCATGVILGWRGKQWEVELDRGDELVFVRSQNLRYLDQAPPPKAASKKKKNAKAAAGSGEPAPPSKKIKKKKKKRVD